MIIIFNVKKLIDVNLDHVVYAWKSLKYVGESTFLREKEFHDVYD